MRLNTVLAGTVLLLSASTLAAPESVQNAIDKRHEVQLPHGEHQVLPSPAKRAEPPTSHGSRSLWEDFHEIEEAVSLEERDAAQQAEENCDDEPFKRGKVIKANENGGVISLRGSHIQCNYTRLEVQGQGRLYKKQQVDVQGRFFPGRCQVCKVYRYSGLPPGDE